MNERLVKAVLPLLDYQRRTGKEVSLDECVAEADDSGVRRDLVILLVRHELPVKHWDGSLLRHVFVDVSWSRSGGIYRDDNEALEALRYVARALGKTVVVQVVELH